MVNIYAPKKALDRTKLWNAIREDLPQLEHWCMAGDFNMIEDQQDRVGGSGVTIHGPELAAWERLCLDLRISDVWHMHNFYRPRESLRFSRSNRRLEGTNIARLDRFYVGECLAERGGTIQIVSGTTFSDHAPVLMTLLENASPKSKKLKIPNSILVKAEYKQHIVQIWNRKNLLATNIGEQVATAITQIPEFFQEETRQHFELQKMKERLHQALASLQRLQELRLTCEWTAS